MNETHDATAGASLETVVAGLEKAWNTGDGGAFAAFFAEDADFVNIFGMHAKGKQAIADGHNMIFRTVYAGSVLSCRIKQTRMIADEVALVHMGSRLRVPQGPLAGEMNSVPSAVLKRNGAEWKIVAFQNTLVQSPPPLRDRGYPVGREREPGVAGGSQ